VLIDAAVTDPLAEELMKASCLRAEYARDNPDLCDATDEAIMQYAKQEDRVVITTETGFTERAFPICSHPGIIVLALRERHEAIGAKIFQKFLLSGYRKYTKDALTHLYSDKAVVRNHDGAKAYDIPK
jgi:predicted nuclease of predicted toxin-antitoxin system